jgi:outer membrane protein OmpA-like peptidoglycan-associated protein
MTAMMVLCLVTMASAILMSQKEKNESSRQARERDQAIKSICEDLERRLASASGATVSIKNCDSERNRIDFGDQGRFASGSDRLPAGAGPAIADLVPKILEIADSTEGSEWVRRVIVEGYTDTSGGYLYNLDLSLRRSQRVMCMLMDRQANTHLNLSDDQIRRVQQLFVAGGVSFADPKETADQSRRVEMRIEFYPLGGGGDSPESEVPVAELDTCQI